MLTSVEGFYENGQVYLLESLPDVERARVVVTVLPDSLSRLPRPITDEQSRSGFAPNWASAAVDTDESEISELGKLLLKIRHRAIAQGMSLESIEAILDEVVREKRAEVGNK